MWNGREKANRRPRGALGRRSRTGSVALNTDEWETRRRLPDGGALGSRSRTGSVASNTDELDFR